MRESERELLCAKGEERVKEMACGKFWNGKIKF